MFSHIGKKKCWRGTFISRSLRFLIQKCSSGLYLMSSLVILSISDNYALTKRRFPCFNPILSHLITKKKTQEYTFIEKKKDGKSGLKGSKSDGLMKIKGVSRLVSLGCASLNVEYTAYASPGDPVATEEVTQRGFPPSVRLNVFF